MHLNPLSKHLRNLPKVKATPNSEVSKVLNKQLNKPINRAAARELAREKCWLALPPEEVRKPIKPSDFDALQARLKTEYNEHAKTRDALGQCRAELKLCKTALKQKEKENETLHFTITQLKATIEQLEDLKL